MSKTFRVQVGGVVMIVGAMTASGALLCAVNEYSGEINEASMGLSSDLRVSEKYKRLTISVGEIGK